MKILLILAHPDYDNSSKNKQLINYLKEQNIQDLTIHNIQNINLTEDTIKQEQNLISKYDKIIFQYPVYWFAWPSMLGSYLEKVLTAPLFFSYQKNQIGELSGKKFAFIATTGCTQQYYDNEMNIGLIQPGQSMSKYCNMKYMGFWISYGDQNIDEKTLKSYLNFVLKN